MSMPEPIVIMREIEKVYKMGEEDHKVLKGISFSVDKGELVAILGPSGSGKSTMMNILGCLDTPTSGEYILHDKPVQEMDEEDLAKIRSKEVGFIFQSFQLLPRMNAMQNVMLPLIYAGVPASEREGIAIKMLKRVGLEDKLHHFPNQLSGGQQQRVAIARALSTNPTILLADEPTGALDQKTGRQVMALFHELHEEGHTILMITHDASIAAHAGRIVRLLDGRLTEGDVEDV